jgi:DNA-binding winged helix-turn-helix (wHTH) protein
MPPWARSPSRARTSRTTDGPHQAGGGAQTPSAGPCSPCPRQFIRQSSVPHHSRGLSSPKRLHSPVHGATDEALQQRCPAGGYEFDGFVLDEQRRCVWRRDGTPVRLPGRLFNALLIFVEHPGELLGKDWLMEALWPGLYVGENSLSQIVCGLRRALCMDGRGYIQTESRYGFRFVCPVKRLPLGDAAGALSTPVALDTLSLILSMQAVIAQQLCEALAPYPATSERNSGRLPSRTPAFPL